MLLSLPLMPTPLVTEAAGQAEQRPCRLTLLLSPPEARPMVELQQLRWLQQRQWLREAIFLPRLLSPPPAVAGAVEGAEGEAARPAGRIVAALPRPAGRSLWPQRPGRSAGWVCGPPF